uniref:Uncharacterized protein n=1 Tax=Arundo donax TaxID=35708 RepID=A0A0A9AIM6_ARUDO
MAEYLVVVYPFSCTETEQITKVATWKHDSNYWFSPFKIK